MEENTTTETTQSAILNDDVVRYEAYFKEYKGKRGKIAKRFKENEEFYDGLQLDKNHSPDRCDLVLNHVNATVQRIIALISQSRPISKVIPPEPSDEFFANKLAKTHEFLWRILLLNKQLREVEILACIYGTGFWEITWDNSLRKGLGDFKIDVLNPKQVFPDPDATDLENCRRLIIATPMEIGLIKQLFNKNVNPEIEVSEFTRNDNISYSKNAPSNQTYYDTMDAGGHYWKDTGTGYQSNQDYSTQRAIVKKCFDNTNPKKYPNGRLFIWANGVKLWDDNNPFPGGQPNIVQFSDKLNPGLFWAEGEIDILRKPQQALNKMIQQVIDNATLMGNAQIVTDDQSLDIDEVMNSPGHITVVQPGSRFDRVAPPPLPNYHFALINLLRASFDSLSGVNDVTEGRKPEGIQSGRAIGFLQEAALTLMNLKLKNIEDSLCVYGNKMSKYILSFYKGPRILAIVGEEGNPEYMKINQPFGDMVITPERKDVDYDTIIEIGSDMPQNKETRFGYYKDMFMLGVIDAETLIEASPLPNKTYIIKKIKEKEAQQRQMQEMQMQAQMMGGKPPQSPPQRSLPPPNPSSAMMSRMQPPSPQGGF